jgi:cytochrome c553
MLKNIILTLLMAMTQVAVAHGDDIHMSYVSEAKTMVENGEKYHKNISIVRKMHPDFMNHKRDKTLRQGVRSEEGSLKACVNCHGGFDENGNALRIDSEGQFCADCHKKVGTTVDCFSCHKATSKGKN